jgi:hypothetical protein
MTKSPTISILRLWFIIAISPHHPPIVIATRMMAPDDLISPCTTTHATDADPFVFWHHGEIDIETYTKRKRFRQDLCGYLPNERTH